METLVVSGGSCYQSTKTLSGCLSLFRPASHACLLKLACCKCVYQKSEWLYTRELAVAAGMDARSNVMGACNSSTGCNASPVYSATRAWNPFYPGFEIEKT